MADTAATDARGTVRSYAGHIRLYHQPHIGQSVGTPPTSKSVGVCMGC